nr:type VI immunity family protein [Cystobacter fuscus]
MGDYRFEYRGRALGTASHQWSPQAVSAVSFWLPTEYLEEQGPVGFAPWPWRWRMSCPPVNAAPSRMSTHDSGPSWVASPSMYDSFIRCSMPVYPGALTVHRIRPRSPVLAEAKAWAGDGDMQPGHRSGSRARHAAAA